MTTIHGSLTDRASILTNRQGTLTEAQRDLLRLTSGLTFWFALGSAVAIGGIVAWAMNTQAASLPANTPPIPAYFWIVLGVAIGAPLLYLGGQMVRSARIRHELAAGNLGSEEGRVEWTGRRYRVAASVHGLRSVIMSYVVGGERFDVGGRAYDALVEGEAYRVYYTPLGRTLLSVEAIPPGSPPP